MSPGAGPERRRPANRRRLFTGAASVAGHLAIAAAILAVHGDPPGLVEPAPMAVQLVAPRPEPPPAPPAVTPDRAAPGPPRPTPPSPPPPRRLGRPQRQPTPEPLVAVSGPPSDRAAEVSEAALAQATTAGAGGGGAGGRPCDMVLRLQTALRRDARVQAAVAEARSGSSKAMLVWNGDWIRSGAQEGNGLAALREAIMWEVGFAPEACRAEPVRGLVLISLADAPGSARLVVGADRWRWSDLLRPRARPFG